jgi:dUTPase
VTIEPFQRVAQIVFLPVIHPDVFSANSTTDYLLPGQEIKGVVTRGDKGFGSTGK